MHKKIIASTMAALSKDHLNYFQAVVARLERDRRTERRSNVVYTILKDIMPDCPIYLEQEEFVDLLFDFIDNNGGDIRNIMYSHRFIHHPQALRRVTGKLLQQIFALSFDKHERGEIDTGDPSVHKLTWPYRDTDILDPDEEPDQWQAAVSRSEEWKSRNKTDRRKHGLSRIDDQAMEKLRQKSEKDTH